MAENALITASFRTQALAMPDRATAFLATNPAPQDIANQVAKGAAMLEYSRRIDATQEELIAVTKPIAKSVLILKAGLGVAMPAGKVGAESVGCPHR